VYIPLNSCSVGSKTSARFEAPKNNKIRRTVKLTASTVEALKRHKAAQNEERLVVGAPVRDRLYREAAPASLYMVGASILLAWPLNRTLRLTDIVVPWWVDAPSVVGFYGIIYTLFDKRGWRYPAVRLLGFVDIPDLNGAWFGTVRPSGGEHASEHPATVEITQTWRDLCMSLRTPNSSSRSSIAAVTVGDLSGRW
jgi:SMODS-associating 2TM, beta-strand rich effector domain